jgi:hypothetical protein
MYLAKSSLQLIYLEPYPFASNSGHQTEMQGSQAWRNHYRDPLEFLIEKDVTSEPSGQGEVILYFVTCISFEVHYLHSVYYWRYKTSSQQDNLGNFSLSSSPASFRKAARHRGVQPSNCFPVYISSQACWSFSDFGVEGLVSRRPGVQDGEI